MWLGLGTSYVRSGLSQDLMRRFWQSVAMYREMWAKLTSVQGWASSPVGGSHVGNTVLLRAGLLDGYK